MELKLNSKYFLKKTPFKIQQRLEKLDKTAKIEKNNPAKLNKVTKNCKKGKTARIATSRKCTVDGNQ